MKHLTYKQWIQNLFTGVVENKNSPLLDQSSPTQTSTSISSPFRYLSRARQKIFSWIDCKPVSAHVGKILKGIMAILLVIPEFILLSGAKLSKPKSIAKKAEEIASLSPNPSKNESPITCQPKLKKSSILPIGLSYLGTKNHVVIASHMQIQEKLGQGKFLRSMSSTKPQILKMQILRIINNIFQENVASDSDIKIIKSLSRKANLSNRVADLKIIEAELILLRRNLDEAKNKAKTDAEKMPSYVVMFKSKVPSITNKRPTNDKVIEQFEARMKNDKQNLRGNYVSL